MEGVRRRGVESSDSPRRRRAATAIQASRLQVRPPAVDLSIDQKRAGRELRERAGSDRRVDRRGRGPVGRPLRCGTVSARKIRDEKLRCSRISGFSRRTRRGGCMRISDRIDRAFGGCRMVRLWVDARGPRTNPPRRVDPMRVSTTGQKRRNAEWRRWR
jgi:hypothetical protein